MDGMLDRGLENPRERSFLKALERLKDKTLLIYGAGGFGVEMFRALRAEGLSAAAFLDQNAQALREREGAAVYAPGKAPFPMEECAVLFCIVMDLEERRKVLARLRELGYPLVLEGQALRALLVQPDDRRGESLAEYYESRREKIKEARGLFCDGGSRELYDQVVFSHATGEYGGCERLERPLREQYFPPDIAPEKGWRRFVDCGGYTGDTVENLLPRVGSFEACAVFEPDSRNFAAMAKRLAGLRERIGQRFLFPCAVSGGAEMHGFSSGTGSGGLCASGGTAVQTVSLDMAVPDFHPTLIKMDIEGAELSALAGARNLIRRDRPDLAVCTYHAVNHVWDIPLLLNSWGLGYRFYLRCYNAYTMETVLYAFAREGEDA